MSERTLLIVGGGLAGLTAGCYARMNGWRARIFEHGLTLGGLCTSWRRGEYTIDASVPWLIGGGPGGAMRGILEELGVLPGLAIVPVERFARYEHFDGWAVDIGRKIDALAEDLAALSPEDRETVARLFAAIDAVGDPPASQDARDVQSFAQKLRALWETRLGFGPAAYLRGSIAEWTERHVRGPRLADLLTHLMPRETPMMYLAVLLGQLAAGQLSRPMGGFGKLRDALVARYRELGGEAVTNATVDEILLTDGYAVGVRLEDGTQVRGDVVVTTSSAFENIHRLLGGRYGDGPVWDRLQRWRTAPPQLMINLGVAQPLDDLAPALLLRQERPFHLGGPPVEALHLRLSDGDPTLAPRGHGVIQGLIPTTWDHWAEAGDAYNDEKQRALETFLQKLEPRFPGIAYVVRASDVATPLSFWRWARAWRGVTDGWMATTETFGTHPAKRIASVARLYFAGQWVEPGGGIPTSIISGRQVVRMMCADFGMPFAAAGGTTTAASASMSP